MKLCKVMSFWVFLAVVHCNENGESKYSFLESYAMPMINTELKQLRNHAEQRYNFSRRLIPFFENYFTTQSPSMYTLLLTQILGGGSQVTFETSDILKNILNEIWSLTPNMSNPRVEQFEQCMKKEMGPLRTEQIANWAKNLIERNDRQVKLAVEAIRRVITSTEVDTMMINAANAECVTMVLLTMPRRYSGNNVCYRRPPLENCSQQCFYVEETHYCTSSWLPRKNTSTSRISDIVDSFVNAHKFEDFQLDNEIFPSYVTEENFNTNLEHLQIVAPFYFTMRSNVTDVSESLENQKRVIAYIRDGLPQGEFIDDEFDFDSLPEVSERDNYMADAFLECTLRRRRQNYQEYFYNRLHCTEKEYIEGMLLVANLVDEYNMARVGLECYADIEDTVVNRYTETLSEELLPLNIRD